MKNLSQKHPARRPIALGALAAAVLVLGACSSTAADAPDASEARTSAAPEAAPQEPAAPEEAGQEESEQDESSDGGAGDGAQGGDGVEESTALVTVDDREFVFELTSCALYLQDDEVALGGLGGETGSDIPSHFSGDAVSWDGEILAEFRIDIGADGPWQSMDEFVSIGTTLGGDYEIAEDGAGYLITSVAWDEQGSDLGAATIRFTC